MNLDLRLHRPAVDREIDAEHGAHFHVAVEHGRALAQSPGETESHLEKERRQAAPPPARCALARRYGRLVLAEEQTPRGERRGAQVERVVLHVGVLDQSVETGGALGQAAETGMDDPESGALAQGVGKGARHGELHDHARVVGSHTHAEHLAHGDTLVPHIAAHRNAVGVIEPQDEEHLVAVVASLGGQVVDEPSPGDHGRDGEQPEEGPDRASHTFLLIGCPHAGVSPDPSARSILPHLDHGVLRVYNNHGAEKRSELLPDPAVHLHPLRSLS